MKYRKPGVMVGAPGLYTYGAMRIGGIIRDAGNYGNIIPFLYQIKSQVVYPKYFRIKMIGMYKYLFH